MLYLEIKILNKLKVGSDKFDKIFCEDNLILLQLIADWEKRTDGQPIPESELGSTLLKAGFEWDMIHLYSGITQLLMMQIIQIKQQDGQICYQINQEVANWMLEVAIKRVREEG